MVLPLSQPWIKTLPWKSVLCDGIHSNRASLQMTLNYDIKLDRTWGESHCLIGLYNLYGESHPLSLDGRFEWGKTCHIGYCSSEITCRFMWNIWGKVYKNNAEIYRKKWAVIQHEIHDGSICGVSLYMLLSKIKTWAKHTHAVLSQTSKYSLK